MSNNTKQKTEAKKRAEILKQLRSERKDSVDRTRQMLKAHNAVRTQIRQSTSDEPKSVPDIAEMTGLPANEILWHITAMKKYDLMVETGMSGEYYLYQSVKEQKK